MITEPASFDSFECLRIEMDLIAKCLISDDATFKNALVLSTTSKVYYYMLKSSLFFRSLVEIMDPTHPWLKAKKTEHNEMALLDRCVELRNAFSYETKIFPVILYGTPLADEKGIEIFSITNGVTRHFLKESCPFQSLKIPAEGEVPQVKVSGIGPCVARSEKFLATNHRCNSTVYVYTPDGETLLARYQVEGIVYQLAIINNLLLVMEYHLTEFNDIVIFALDLPVESHIDLIPLPENEDGLASIRPICFGKEYLIYINDLTQFKHRLHALPLSNLSSRSKWIEGLIITGYCTILPHDNHFIEVTFKEMEPYKCDIYKINIIEEKFQKEVIEKEIIIFTAGDAFRNDICIFKDRILFAYETTFNKTTIYSYDILTGKISQLFSIKANGYSFKPQFLTTAENIYYLMMQLNNNCFLTILNYGKLESSLFNWLNYDYY